MSAKKLAGKVAVVTGASKGIGAEIAKQLAAEGAAVVVNYSSSKEGADRVVGEITKNGGRAVAVQADVAKKADIDRLFAEAKKAFGQLDVLVNNAGIYEFSPLEGITEEHYHKQFNLNVLGLLLTTQEAVKHFGRRTRQFTQRRKARSMPSRACWRRNLGRDRFASTPSIRAWWRRKACGALACTRAISASKWNRRLRSAASGKCRTLRPRPCFSRRRIRRGSLERHTSSRAACVD